MAKAKMPVCKKCGKEMIKLSGFLDQAEQVYKFFYWCNNCRNATPIRDRLEDCYNDVDWKDYELRSDDAQANAND